MNNHDQLSNFDSLRSAQMHALVDLARVIDRRCSRRDQHPVFSLFTHAREKFITGKAFVEALEAAEAQGFITLIPDCGASQLGMFRLTGK